MAYTHKRRKFYERAAALLLAASAALNGTIALADEPKASQLSPEVQFEVLRIACEDDSVDACVELARRFEDGVGVEQRTQTAAWYYRRALAITPDDALIRIRLRAIAGRPAM